MRCFLCGAAATVYPGHKLEGAFSAVTTAPQAHVKAGVAAGACAAAPCGRLPPGARAPGRTAGGAHRALGARTELEYAPWAVAAPQFLRVRRLLAGGGAAPPGCAAAWAGYVRDNVTAAWVGGARLAQCAPAPAWRSFGGGYQRATASAECAPVRLWAPVAPAVLRATVQGGGALPLACSQAAAGRVPIELKSSRRAAPNQHASSARLERGVDTLFFSRLAWRM